MCALLMGHLTVDVFNDFLLFMLQFCFDALKCSIPHTFVSSQLLLLAVRTTWQLALVQWSTSPVWLVATGLAREWGCGPDLETCVMEGRTIQIDAAGFMYERNPFRWQSDGRISHVVAQFVWHWQEHHVFQFKRVSVRLDHVIQGDLPLPDNLITDATLHKRLLKRAERETKQTYCECKYLGLKTESGFEPNPAAWTIDGWKSHQQVWLEFSNVRNASTNRLHRVPVHVTTLLNRSTRAPGNPLTVTAARRLRFSLEFMDAFANEKMPGMTFCGVMYECPERPEFVRQLPNDVDIQHEKFFWNLPSGECICKSLVELRDMQPDELTPEDHIDSYKEVADQLGYDILGVPATDLDNSKFDEYRRANDLGNLSERRWEQDIIWAKPEKESEKCWFISNAGLKELLDVCVHIHYDFAP